MNPKVYIFITVLLLLLFFTSCQKNEETNNDDTQPQNDISETEKSIESSESNEANEINETGGDLMAKLLFQGHGSFRLTAKDGTVIYVDPYAGEGYDLPADIILVTHQHGDHNQVDLAAQKKDCVIITNAEALESGKHNSFTVNGIEIEAVEANNKNHNPKDCVGFIITIDGIKVYAAGDTSKTAQMETFAAKEIDYALLPCDGVYNMDLKEAAECAKLIKAKHNIPIHMKPGELFDKEKAGKFDAPNKLTVGAGEEIILEKGQPVSTEVKNFKVDGTKILTPGGGEFLIKGVNVNGPGWVFPRDTLQDVELITDVWQFNTIRLCAAIGWEWAVNNNSDLDAIVKAFTEKGVVVILEVHDYTGIYPPDEGYRSENVKYVYELDVLKEWWVDKAKRFKNNPYVWFNIMNEPGSDNSKESADKWLKIHGEVIEAIRNAGAENIIVLDEHGWGQGSGYYGGKSSYDSAIIRVGPELNKKYNNLVFSLHVYDAWRDGQSRFDDYFRDAKELGLCVILGEYGVGKDNLGQHNAVKGMFNSAIKNNIGRIYWAWDDSLPLTDNDKGAGWTIDKTNGEKPDNLTWVGELIWADNRGLLTAPVPDYSLDLPLLPNGDFEDGMTGWQDWGNSSVQSGESRDGTGNILVVGSGIAGEGGTGGCGRSIDLKPNATYTFSAWGKNNARANPGIDVGVKYRPADDPENEHHVFVTFTGTDWAQKSVTFTTPDKFSGATLFIWKSDAKTTSYLDDLELIEVE